MNQLILVTGSTDGIGLKTAETLLSLGHRIIIHGRNPQKLAAVQTQLQSDYPDADIFAYAADLANLDDVVKLASEVKRDHTKLDVLVNNAGVFKVAQTRAPNGLDVRFVVNTIAPYLLTQLLLPIMDNKGRIINLSSAAQTGVLPQELGQFSVLSDSAAYAKSKLAITMWTRHLADVWGDKGPVIIAVNPASMLGSKMVKQAYGVAGGDLQRGADAIIMTATSDAFANASGAYFDNDIGQISHPHPDAMVPQNNQAISDAVHDLVSRYLD